MGLREIRTLIADDEPIARRVLREQLEAFPEINVIGEAADGGETLTKIKIQQPELVFLDLQMPVMGGFDVVRALHGSSQEMPVIIIVTAYDEHAIKAFDAGAIDYLLKPVSGNRLKKSVERALRMSERPGEVASDIAKIANAQPESAPAGARRIAGRSEGEYILLDPAEILAFQAEVELVWIVTAKKRLLASQSLKALENRLEGSEFQRVHRNAIVNVNHIKKMTQLSSQRWMITLSNSVQLVVSKRQARNIRNLLHW